MPEPISRSVPVRLGGSAKRVLSRPTPAEALELFEGHCKPPYPAPEHLTGLCDILWHIAVHPPLRPRLPDAAPETALDRLPKLAHALAVGITDAQAEVEELAAQWHEAGINREPGQNEFGAPTYAERLRTLSAAFAELRHNPFLGDDRPGPRWRIIARLLDSAVTAAFAASALRPLLISERTAIVAVAFERIGAGISSQSIQEALAGRRR